MEQTLERVYDSLESSTSDASTGISYPFHLHITACKCFRAVSGIQGCSGVLNLDSFCSFNVHRLNTAKIEGSMMPSLMSQIEPTKIFKLYTPFFAVFHSFMG